MKIIKLLTYKRIIWLGIIAILFYFLLYTIFSNDIIEESKSYELYRDGITLIPKVLTNEEIQDIKKLCYSKNYKKAKEILINHHKLNNECRKLAGSNHIFQDYILIIQKSLVHTCHRDNNGDFFNNEQKHPSYTVIVYIEPMEKCLGVIPHSHLDKNLFNYNFSDPVKNIRCNPGDAIIFNANLIHVGTMDKKDDNLRCQMKFTNKEDIDVLHYFQNYNKILNEKNHLPVGLRQLQKRLSCSLPIISNLTQSEIIRTARGSDNGVNIGVFQKMFSFLFYGNQKFYDLPNAF